MAVVTSSAHLNAATAFKNFQYTAAGPEGMGGSRIPAGRSRPSPPTSATSSRCRPSCGRSPTSAAGTRVDPQLFDKKSGSITKIYTQATG